MSDKKDKEEAKGTKKAEAKAVVDATHATKLFNQIKDVPGVSEKAVNNGVGLWVGTTRIVKKPAKGYIGNGLIFRGDVKAADASKVRKNTLIPVTVANFATLKGTVMAEIKTAQEVLKTRAEKKAKAKTEKASKEAAAAASKAATPAASAAA